MCASKPSRLDVLRRRLLAAAGLLLALNAVPAGALEVLRITPAGDDVADATQIVVHFDRPVVPLGRMERNAEEVPVRIAPDPGCQWRWLDAQALACNLVPPNRLRAATRYEVDVAAAAQALDGSRLRRGLQHGFVTERPRLEYAWVTQWQGPGEPRIRAQFSQPVTVAALRPLLRIGDVAVEVEPHVRDIQTPFHTPQGEARRVWDLRPARPLAADRGYALRMAAGLRSALGTQPGLASPEVLRLHTFANLRLLGIQCEVQGKTRLVTQNQAGALCEPLEEISLAFTAPVSAAALRSHLRLSPDPRGDTLKPDDDPWAGTPEPRRPSGSHESGRVYTASLPFGFAAETEYRISVAAGLEDAFGRRLQGPQDLRLRTGARTPRLVFDHDTAVLESGVDSEVPVVATNLQRIDARFDRLTAQGLQTAQSHRVPVPPVRNLAFALPLDVRGMLGAARSGVLRGTLCTPPLTPCKDDREFLAVVTPWQVHAKYGHSNLLVWVSAMADGAPVSAAQVTVTDGLDGEARAQATTDGAGVAQLPGSATLDPQLQRLWWNKQGPLYVRVQRGDDVAVLPLSSDFSVDTWRVSRERISAWRREQHGHLRAWGTTAQGVYRAGDRVQYKLYVRDDAGRSLAPAPPGDYHLQVIDPTGNVVHERQQLKLSSFGAADGAFTLTERAAVGWYRFQLTPAFAEDLSLEPIRVLVSDFVPSPFTVQAELRTERAAPGQTVTAALRAQLHGGGAFAQAPARLTARLQEASFEPVGSQASRYRYDAVMAGGRSSVPLPAQEARLDASGEWTQRLELPDTAVLHGRLVVEGSVRDDRGRSIAAQASVPYFGRDRYIGLRMQDGVGRSGVETQVELLVVDGQGAPQAAVPYYVKIERMERRGARVKGAGNAYITRYTREWVRAATCQGRSHKDGMRCRFTPSQAGEYRVIAMVRDTQDRLHETQGWMYAQGPQAVLWEETPDYSLDLRADREQYRVGQTARLLVKNPFPGARALVTVERYGVLDHWVQALDGSTPVVEVPVKPEYLPGAYVSVVVMSPRVDAPPGAVDAGDCDSAAALTPPSAERTVPPSPACGRGTQASLRNGVDLGKPTFRMGYATLRVEDPHREIAVEVTAQRKQYRPGETVEIDLQATPRRPSGEPIELAVAVLDEAVLDLIQAGTASFDPLQGFTTLDQLDLGNYSLLTRLVGRQKFEKKGANAGGDGGADLALRSVDKFVAYWHPSLPADAQGRARVSFTLPDNLTGWRVLALAVTPGDRMGLGQGTLAVSKPTELRPAMPNQVSQGDRFDAGFTVLNRESIVRTLDVELTVSGGASGRHSEKLVLQPFERRTVQLPVTVVDDTPLSFRARAGDAQDRDALAHTVTVRTRPHRLLAADASSLLAGAKMQLAVQLPETAERGELRVSLSPTVIGGLDGAFGYLRDYPHACWEQQLSRAVMAAHYLKLKPQMTDAAAWPQAQELPQATLDRAADFQAPGGGMAFWTAADEHQSPYLSAYTALAFGWLRELGYTPPRLVSDRLNDYLHELLRDDIAVRGYGSAEARAQLRAVALAALAQQNLLKPEELQRYAAQLPRMGLFGQSLYLQAAAAVPGAESLRGEALERVLARGRHSAGRLALQDDEDSAAAWLLGSTVRSNCAALSALLKLPDGVVPEQWPTRLVRAITQARGTRAQWYNIQENLYCTRAVIDYAARYEREPVQMRAQVSLDGEPLGSLEIAQQRRASLSRALGEADVGVRRQLAVEGSGRGRAYVDTHLRYVERREAQRPVSAGFGIERRYAVYRQDQWQPLGDDAMLRRGERVKVEIEVAVPAWMTYVVVDDPVPGGVEPVNPDLATAEGQEAVMSLDANAYPYPFYHRELRFDAVRHYADELTQGRYRLSWIGQVVATGEFAVEAPRVEAMYDPDVYATGAAWRLRVEEAAQP